MIARCTHVDERSGERCFEAPGHDGAHGYLVPKRVKAATGHLDFDADDDKPGEVVWYVRRGAA